MSTIKIRATRGVVAGVDRVLHAGEVASVDALTAHELVHMGAAVLLDAKDEAAARAAFDADQRRIMREMRRAPDPGSPWQARY
jgi:hypothetical protein